MYFDYTKAGIYFVLNLIPLLIGKERIAEKKERILLKLILIFPWIITMFGLPIITNNNRIERTASDGDILFLGQIERVIAYNILYKSQDGKP
ncbi:MAG: hypothetical protein ACLTAI_14110 [Thomasclavelia sp.]